MAISTRELLLVLRARDEASRVIKSAAGAISSVSAASAQAAQKQIAAGAAMTTVGVGVAYAGLAAIRFLDDATDAAIEYNRQSALTLTQVDKVGVSIKTIKDIGKDVATQVPTDFKKIQTSLYDIFSSMDVTVPQAKNLLTEFSKASVAGQVELQDASRATIGIMNAYGMAATEVNHVNDVMFQLVRKGVGTYGEFATTIGRAVPSAVRAGQSIETLAGMMAFLTRNGLSAAMASASAGRALDAISHPKTIAHFADLGATIDKALGKDRALALFGDKYKDMSIKIRDAAGNIRPMPDIMTELGTAIGKLPAADRAAILQELFKSSGGTIQARRFFDIAVTQFGEFNQRVDEMIGSKGAMEEAYKVMFDNPQAKMQALANSWNILKVNIGDALIPIKVGVAEAFTALFNAFNSLDEKTQGTIVKFAAAAAVFLVVIGVVMAIAGVILMFQGALALAGTTFAAFMTPILIGVAIILALGAAIFLVWKYHEQLWEIIQRVWNGFITAIQPVLEVVQLFASAVGDLVIPMFQNMWDMIMSSLVPAWETLKQAWNDVLAAGAPLWAAIERIMPTLKLLGIIIGVTLVGAFTLLIAGIMIAINTIVGVLGPTIEMIANIISAVINIIIGIVKVFIGIITGDFGLMKDGLIQIVTGLWDVIKSIFVGAFNIIVGLIKGFGNGVIAVFQWIYDILVGHSIVPDMITAIIAVFTGMPARVIAAVISLGAKLFSWATEAMTQAKNAITNKANEIVSFVKGVPGKILSALGNTGSMLSSAGRNIMNSLLDGLRSAGQSVINYVSNLAAQVRNLWPFSPAKAGPLKSHPLDEAGANMMKMLSAGIESRRDLVLGSMKRIALNVSETEMNAPVVPYTGGRGPGPDSDGMGITQIFNITTQEIDPVKHGADLGFEIARRVG